VTCGVCKHGETKPGFATVTLQRAESTVILRAVPADICDNCDEYYLDEATTRRVLQMGEDAVREGAELEVRRYAA
jgi:YgiT-type zinc finger domain-containing protein